MKKLVHAVWYMFYQLVLRRLPLSYRYGWIGRFGHRLRSHVACRMFAYAGEGVGVERDADFGSGKHVYVEDYGQIGEGFRLMGRGNIRIGSHAMMGPGVLAITDNHRAVGSGFDGYHVGNIVIGIRAWIGARAVLLQGVTIGEGAIVGAGAVVTKDIPAYTVAAGNPCRVVKERIKDG